jgi:hypothetical protein
MRGKPLADFDNLEHWQGKFRCEIGLACPPGGEDIIQLNNIVAGVLEKYGFDDLSECVVGWRSIVKRNYILFAEDNQPQAEQCANEIIAKADSKGYGLTHSRSNYPIFRFERTQDQGMAVLNSGLKSALDPKHTLV